MIRDQISSEMWEIVNRLYLFVKNADPEMVRDSGSFEFFEKIKEHAILFQGVTDSTFPRKLGYEFIISGRYLERADKTGRILDSMQYMTKTMDVVKGGAVDTGQWVALLRGCSALEAYHRIYVSDVVGDNVSEFLLLSREFPIRRADLL